MKHQRVLKCKILYTSSDVNSTIESVIFKQFSSWLFIAAAKQVCKKTKKNKKNKNTPFPVSNFLNARNRISIKRQTNAGRTDKNRLLLALYTLNLLFVPLQKSMTISYSLYTSCKIKHRFAKLTSDVPQANEDFSLLSPTMEWIKKLKRLLLYGCWCVRSKGSNSTKICL